jgi:hypothetical protein
MWQKLLLAAAAVVGTKGVVEDKKTMPTTMPTTMPMAVTMVLIQVKSVCSLSASRGPQSLV